MKTFAIQIESLTRNFGSVAALDGISLEIGRGEFFSLLGPSGCGKTTLLRVIAGLERPDTGELRIAGKSMADVPAQKRPVNTVFQNYALFPHLNVWDNVAFGLRMLKVAPPQVEERVRRALDLVHIADLSKRFPSQISGGQKQRVALARALVNEPDVLLLDEPLAAIDAKLRGQLQAELKNLQRQLGTTFLYVTHDQEEALSLSDRIAVMNRGRVEQLGTPREIYLLPRSRFVATFLGACNVLEARVGQSHSVVQTSMGPLKLPGPPSVRGAGAIAIRRENIQIGANGTENVFQGRIEDVSFTGAQTDYALAIGEVTIRVRQQSHLAVNQLGDRVDVYFPPESLFWLES